MATAKKQATKVGAAKKPATKVGAAKKPATKVGAAKKRAAKKPATKVGAAKKPAAKKRAAKKPATKVGAAKKPAAKKLDPTPPSSGDVPELAALLRIRAQLLAYALSLPGAWEDHPWGESVAKVGKKVFAFLGTTDPAYLHKGIGMSVKLPQSGDLVLALPFAEPTGYGLGRAGWVSIYLQPADLPPMPMLTAWIDESFRAVAPKTQIAELDALRGGTGT